MFKKELVNKFLILSMLIMVVSFLSLTGCKKDDNITNPFTGTGSVTFNGMVIGGTDTINYVNRTTSILLATGYYAKKEGTTNLIFSAYFQHNKADGVHFYDSVYINLSFHGNSTGTYNWADRNGNYASVYFIKHNTISSAINVGSTTITNYSAVDGKIDGSFQGVVIGTKNDTLNISGNFSAYRTVDVDSLKTVTK